MRKFLLWSILLLLLSGYWASTQQDILSTTPQVYFDGDIKGQIIDEIRASTEKIDMAVMDLSDKDVIKNLITKRDKDKVVVRIIIDPKYHHHLEGQGFKEHEELRILGGRKEDGLMHNKVCIFDDRWVMTGSYNISDRAYKKNYENAIFLSDPTVIKAYQDQFDNLWKEASLRKKKKKK